MVCQYLESCGSRKRDKILSKTRLIMKTYNAAMKATGMNCRRVSRRGGTASLPCWNRIVAMELINHTGTVGLVIMMVVMITLGC